MYSYENTCKCKNLLKMKKVDIIIYYVFNYIYMLECIIFLEMDIMVLFYLPKNLLEGKGLKFDSF